MRTRGDAPLKHAAGRKRSPLSQELSQATPASEVVSQVLGTLVLNDGEAVQKQVTQQTASTSESTNPKSGLQRKRRTRSGGKRKNMMEEGARKAFLDRDEWTRNVQPRSVTCGGCNKVFSLDKRNGAYYASLWLKHRDVCRSIKRLRAKRKEIESATGYSRAVDVSDDVLLGAWNLLCLARRKGGRV